ncbi:MULTISPECIES: hypothetical protein [Streptomyces]|uniref:hypothetical protein n=1 Tax=Streptomyces TaxID=1883 RepID=UPI001F423E01|nr:hypothetical protein [Streptomyces sp. A1-5]UJB39478.1 hypothetical protein HRD51_04775 [Streptomyces sp. A1-5]
MRAKVRSGQEPWQTAHAPVEELTGNPDTDIRLGPVTEIGYNALHHRLGVPMVNP